MALTKYKIGELVQTVDERNDSGILNFYGINIDKEFMPTVASTDTLDATNYKMVRKNRFVYSGMQTGRDKCIRISLYSAEIPIIVSPAYITFEIKATDIIIPQYFFMLFLSKEKDRLGWFYSDGSIRSNLDWDVFCDIELNLPTIEVQQKYVNIYNAMVANQKAYEKGLDDLKLVCDGFIEDLRRKLPCEKIGKYLQQRNERNSDGKIKIVMGLSTKKEFRVAQSRVNLDELSGYKIMNRNDIAFVPTTDTWKVLAFAINKFDYKIVVSPIYEVFSVNEQHILPNYLAMWLSRKEFDRYARYHSWGSARENFSFDDMCEVEIPIPNISVQQSIVDIYNQYLVRKKINEKLKAQIKNLCPIFIKGSLKGEISYDK